MLMVRRVDLGIVCAHTGISSNHTTPMALLSQASDLQTKKIVWIETNTATGKQINSHGSPAVDLASRAARAHRNDVRATQWG